MDSACFDTHEKLLLSVIGSDADQNGDVPWLGTEHLMSGTRMRRGTVNRVIDLMVRKCVIPQPPREVGGQWLNLRAAIVPLDFSGFRT